MTEPRDGALVAGRIGRPHGLDGSFYVVEAMPSLLTVGASVRVGDREAELLARKGTDEHPILRLSIAGDRSAAEALRGSELRVARSAAPPLGDDEFWADDLVGCSVVSGERVLGEVSRLVGYPSCEVLEVGTLLIPLVRDAIVAVDPAARRIEVDGAFLGIEEA